MWDYQATEIARLWRKYWLRFVIGNLVGLGVLGWVVYSWPSTDEGAGMVRAWSLAALAVVLALTAQIWYLPLRYWTTFRRRYKPMKLAFSDRGFRLTTSHCDSFLAWRACDSFEEIGRAFLIYSRPGHYCLVSKRCLPPEAQIQLRQILQETVKRSDE